MNLKKINIVVLLILFMNSTLLTAEEISVKITKKYLNFPVSSKVERAEMTFTLNGKIERSFEIRLAESNPDYWVFVICLHSWEKR